MLRNNRTTAGAPSGFPCARAALPHQEGEHRPHRDYGPRHPPPRLAAELPAVKDECSRAIYEILQATGVFKDDPPAAAAGRLSSRLSRSVAARRRRCGGRPQALGRCTCSSGRMPLSAWRWRSGRRRCRRLQIGKQKAPAMPASHDDAVARRIELFRLSTGSDSPSTSTEYSRKGSSSGARGETRILGGRRPAVTNDLLGKAFAHRAMVPMQPRSCPCLCRLTKPRRAGRSAPRCVGGKG